MGKTALLGSAPFAPDPEKSGPGLGAEFPAHPTGSAYGHEEREEEKQKHEGIPGGSKGQPEQHFLNRTSSRAAVKEQSISERVARRKILCHEEGPRATH